MHLRVKFLVWVIVLLSCIPVSFSSVIYTKVDENNFQSFKPISGDVNCDGIDDLILSNHNYSSNRGRIYIMYGGDTFDLVPDFTITGEKAEDRIGGNYGVYISTSDLNDDGCDDILVGTSSRRGDDGVSWEGDSFVFYGNDELTGDRIITSADLYFDRTEDYMWFYGAGFSAGYFNSDENLDLIIRGLIREDATYVGTYTSVFNQSQTGFDVNNPDDINLYVGYDVYSAESGVVVLDFNHDGFDDLLTPELTGTASAGNEWDSRRDGLNLLVNDGQNNFTKETEFLQEHFTDYLGRDNTSMGDLNEDGIDDFCTGAYRTDIEVGGSTWVDAGRVYCFFGRENFESSYSVLDADIILDGTAAYDSFGRDLELHDINNDGHLDLLVGAYQSSYTSGLRHGKFFIYLGDGTGSFDETPWYSDIRTSGNRCFGAHFGVGYWDNGDYPMIAITEPGTAGTCSGTPTVEIFKLTYDTPDFGDTTHTQFESELYGSFTFTGGNQTIQGIQWGTEESYGGTWRDCTSVDSAFDSASEDFVCEIDVLRDGDHRIYFRGYDTNKLYIPLQYYGNHGDVILDRKHPLKPKLNLKYQTQAAKHNGVDKYYDPESQDFIVSQNKLKLYFDVKEETTSVEQIMVCERQDFRRCAWKDYDGDYNIELSNGEEKKRLYFKFKDSAGNVSDTYSQLIKLDKTPPDLSLTKIGKIDYDSQYKVYYYTVPSPVLQGETEPKSWVKVWVDGNLYGNEIHSRETKDGTWLVQGSNLTYGRHSVVIESEDQAGNKSELKLELIIDPNR